MTVHVGILLICTHMCERYDLYANKNAFDSPSQASSADK